MITAMPKDYTLWHLNEAAEELTRLIKGVEAEDGEFELGIGVAHLFHHLNTAWNARDASAQAIEECSEEDWYKWRRFPDDLPDEFSGIKT